MKKLIKFNRKGQIRGVDFALSMIIFMIIFAEVIVLTLTFLEPKYQNLGSRAFEDRANQISDVFFTSTGYPVYWEYNYATQFNSFGLRKLMSTDLDPNKISRINPLSLHRISYESIRANLTRENDLGFQLRIESLFEASCSLALTQPNGLITVNTSISDCAIWNFVVAPNNSVIFTEKATTDNLGEYASNFPLGSTTLPNGFFSLIVFAKSPEGYFAINYYNALQGSEINANLQMLIQESQNNNGQTLVQTAFAGTSLNTISATLLYPYEVGNEVLASQTATVTTPNTEENFLFRLPTNGTSVVILSGQALFGYTRKIVIFPSILTDNFDTIFGDESIPENREVVQIEKLVLIRECIFKAVLKVWSE